MKNNDKIVQELAISHFWLNTIPPCWYLSIVFANIDNVIRYDRF